ncbi:nuclear intron maturase 2, mitochondrial [Punica granatum]|uniref:Nuclear intron maturase 2, mitochondrial n=2 Tax=Punica granatum TaxID=22663 RepID=A0A218XE97_PUNGR|nr:nuclear intron maturase 2, mitochondrial [Punica granatum]XP_031380227.1 nuclear intron maturase 2, mitochondrial [Punica granatum]XP_031380228.1 nuclear intron maturase 2, mitochondrial [Punica granatum]XP_031380230.1 nuclear intron maturase 2, mitochondrial [Punica granatum]XP_031380231.1 nuclear intron maturase 2, mitochondrial [Punica granatum]XP_031380232.1 nuclear intron maturase 2, mitochondrial [Punica granatum]XP_031380233.1 nuclear intron maturase 2, mitochondrial [Punica granatu
MHQRLSLLTVRIIGNASANVTGHSVLHSQFSHFRPGNSGFALFRFLSFPMMHRRAPPDPDDPANLLKEDGVSVCSQMWIENFREPDRIVSNLSSYLRRFELWVLAYQKVCIDETGSYMPKSSIQRPALEDLLALRNAVLDNRFKWGARLDFFIKSPKDKTDYQALSKRKIKALLTTTQPTPFQDRIVQEVLLMILEPIYESSFSQKSFAFRPGRNAHTVLRVIRRSFAGYLWYIKGDLSTILDGVKVGLVIGSLMRDVRDKRVIDLIKSALVTPVITTKIDDGEKKKKKKRKYQKKRVLAEDEPKPDPYWLETFFGFAPEEAEKRPNWGHCGILSPLLTNICLDELDRWMETKIKEFYKPSKSDVIWNCPEGEQEHGNTSWPEFVPTSGPDKTRKMDYVRYGGHILIGVRGPRADAATLRKQLIEFCDQKYMLKLDNETLPIEHITKGIMFLDHVLCRRVVYPTLRYTATGGKIISEKGVGTLLSVTASLKQCIKQFRKLKFLKGDRDPDPQPCFRMFHATQSHTNAQMNKFLSTMVEWYRFADNRKKVVNFCSYIIRGSLAKLYAAKYKLRSRAKVYKIGSRNLSRPLKEKKGQSPEYHNLLRMGLVESIDGLQYTRMSLVPETDYSLFPSNWRPDHEKALLEYITLDNPKTQEEQRSCIREQGLVSPQDYISMLVWNYKRNAIPLDQLSLLKSVKNNADSDQKLLLSLGYDKGNGDSKEEEEENEGFHVAQL